MYTIYHHQCAVENSPRVTYRCRLNSNQSIIKTYKSASISDWNKPGTSHLCTELSDSRSQRMLAWSSNSMIQGVVGLHHEHDCQQAWLLAWLAMSTRIKFPACKRAINIIVVVKAILLEWCKRVKFLQQTHTRKFRAKQLIQQTGADMKTNRGMQAQPILILP